VNWDEYFAKLAQAAAEKSKDATTKVGSCVVDVDMSLLSTGYNGPPRNSRDSRKMLEGKARHLWVIHAEENAVLFALAAIGRRPGMLRMCRLYCTHRPCARCLRLAAHVGIRDVVYGYDGLDDEQRDLSTEVQIELNVEVRKFLERR